MYERENKREGVWVCVSVSRNKFMVIGTVKSRDAIPLRTLFSNHLLRPIGNGSAWEAMTRPDDTIRTVAQVGQPVNVT